MAMKIHLLVIDPQNDFCHPDGSLFVPGADKDMDRLSLMVSRLKNKLADIHVTLDSHQEIDISHPSWFVDADGNHPPPFTLISSSDLRDGIWRTTTRVVHDRTLKYLEELERKGRYPHTIWPVHCTIATQGHNVHSDLRDAISEWTSRFALVDYVTKGSNPYTEHFSAVQAEVPDPADPTTQLNARLVQTLEDADVVLLAGEALSHCLMSTVRDIVDNFSNPEYTKKCVLLEDATSSVPSARAPNGEIIPAADFERFGAQFITDMRNRGMQITTSDQFLRTV